jgi:hypothetical protein
MAETTHPIPPPYEPPHVERVLSPEDLEREILYAGGTASLTDHE